MKKVIRYQCPHCKKDFKTPNKHYCKFNPILKNCFTCRFLKDWEENSDGTDVGIGFIRNPNYPDCAANEVAFESWDIEIIKQVNYDMQCERWQEGKYDHKNS